jgi:hypothetical protein
VLRAEQIDEVIEQSGAIGPIADVFHLMREGPLSDPRQTWQSRMSLFPTKRYSLPALVLGEGGNGHEIFCDCDILEFYGSHYRRLGG